MVECSSTVASDSRQGRKLAINRDKVTANAIKFLQAGKYDRAIAEFKKLVDDDPSDVRTLLKIGDTFVKMGHTQKAIGAYEQVATIYSDQGFYLKAVAVYKQMLRVDSTLPEIHLKLAEMYQQLNLSSDALQHYHQVAVVYEQQGRSQETLTILKRMVDLDPDNLPSRIKLAELFAQQGLSNEAISEFRSATDYLKEQDRIDDYIRVAERLIYFDPSAIDVTREVAKIYMQRGDYKIALGKLQICFKADPRNLETLQFIGQAFSAMDQLPKAVSVFKEIARIHDQTSNAAEARTWWQKILNMSPGDSEAQIALGIEQPAAAQPAPSGAYAQPAPSGAYAQPAPSGAYAQPAPSGAYAQPAPSGAYAPPAPQVNPEEEQLRRLMTETDVYVKYGLRDKALEHLEKIIEMRPEHIEAYEKKKSISADLKNADGVVEALQQLVVLGEKQNDARTPAWRNELNAHNKPAALPPVVAAIEEEDDEDILLDDDALILEPESDFGEPYEEVAAISQPIGENNLPNDVQLNAPALLQLPADEEILNDSELILGETGTLSAEEYDEHNGLILSGEDEDLAAAAQMLLDNASGILSSEEGFAATENEAILERASEDSSTTRYPVDDDAQQLIDDALVGVEDMGDLGDLDEALRVAESFIQEEAQEAADYEDAPYEEEDIGNAMLGDTPPYDEFEAIAQQANGFDGGEAKEDYASTEIMSLSPNELAEIRAFANASQQASPIENNQPTEQFESIASTQAETLGTADEAAFSEATVAMNISAADVLAGKIPLNEQPQEAVAPKSFMTDDAFISDASMNVPESQASESTMSLLQPDELDAVAAAAVEPTPIPPEMDLNDAPAEVSIDDDKPALGVSEQAHGFENDAATQFYPEEMEEAEFFIQQGIYDEAREILEEIHEELEDSVRAKWMLDRVNALENDEEEPPAPWASALEDSLQEELGDFDLEAALDNVLPEDDGQVSLDEVLSAFKKGVAETVADNDAETHYSLGIAYREMGLSNEAISEFELSAKNASKAVDSLNLIGLCHIDAKAFEKALAAFESSLAIPGLNSKQQGTNEYQRGLCLIELGRAHEAVSAFQKAKDLKSDMPDLQQRLQAAEEAVQNMAPPPSGLPRQSKNIDYV